MVQIVLAARGRITTHFGEDIGRGWPHRGVDQGHGDGNAVDLEIRAPAAGKVIAVGRDGSYGLRIIILHDDFTVSLLAHHARQFVSKGDRVEQGQVIAEMGNTGTVYVHNHQEFRDKFGGQLDPLLHLAPTPSLSDLSSLPPTKIEGFLMALNDDEQLELLSKTRAVYAALFTDQPTSLGSSAGVLKVIAGLEKQAKIQYDVAFKTTEVTLADGTKLPGGVLKSLAK